MIEFVWPYVLAVMPLPLVLRLLMPRAGMREAALFVPFFRTLARLDARPTARVSRSFIIGLLSTLAWILLVIAAARPQWIGEPVQLPATGRDLMLVVDVSGSMEAQDMQVAGQTANRLQVVKSVIGDFVKRRTGDRLGLILFAARAYTQVPLTFDRATVEKLLNEAEIGIVEENATAIGDGIGLGVKHLQKRPQTSRVLIMLTDGVNNAGSITPQQAGDLAREEGVKIYTIGIGAEVATTNSLFGPRTINPSADLDEESLNSLAVNTGGRFFRARDQRELERIYAVLDELEPVEQQAETFRPTLSLFYWPLGAAVVLSFLVGLLRLPWRIAFGRDSAESATASEGVPT
ncbi:MAG TPA: VWA domain-containing protein [Candidatus Acidoferrum sp.]|nr:VWA domain-containing protein [Candidatus Acidoferrum sp.]